MRLSRRVTVFAILTNIKFYRSFERVIDFRTLRRVKVNKNRGYCFTYYIPFLAVVKRRDPFADSENRAPVKVE